MDVRKLLFITLLPSLAACSDRARLEAAALAKLDTIGLDFFCNKVTDTGLTNITLGTATGGNGGKIRFPAIMANYTGTCISALNGERDTEMISKTWIFFSLDDEADILHCYKISGTLDGVEEHAADCEFQPNAPK